MTSTIIWLIIGVALYMLCALGVYRKALTTTAKYPLSNFPILLSVIRAAMSAAWPVTMLLGLGFLGLNTLFPQYDSQPDPPKRKD